MNQLQEGLIAWMNVHSQWNAHPRPKTKPHLSPVVVSLFVKLDLEQTGDDATIYRNHAPEWDSRKHKRPDPDWRKHRIPNKKLREHPALGHRLLAMPVAEARQLLS